MQKCVERGEIKSLEKKLSTHLRLVPNISIIGQF